MPEKTRAVVLQYFHAWQEPADYAAFRATLAPDVIFDPGGQRIEGADKLTATVRATESPWKGVTLLASMFAASAATLVYEGVDRQSGIRTRVAEYVTIEAEHITKILATICVLR